MTSLMNEVIRKNQRRNYLVGPNSTGKTHILNQIYRDNEEIALFFDETGTYQFLKNREKVLRSTNNYVYPMEETRGEKNKSNPEIELISEKSQSIIEKVKFINSKIIDKKESSGIVKIKKMLSILLEYNLNAIEIIIMDEPENFLDETNLKYIIDLLEVFKKEGIKLFIASHSARFLELSSAKIEELFVCAVSFDEGNIKYEVLNKTLGDIKCIYNGVKKEIELNLIVNKNAVHYGQLFQKINFLDDGEINKQHDDKLPSNGKVLDMYLETIIESFDFYQVLLYKKVIIVEGLTEKLILSRVPVHDLDYQNFYFSNGKIHIPFYIELFLSFNLEVMSMFDSDILVEEPMSNKFICLLTEYLVEKYRMNQKVRLISSERKDLEEDYTVNDILEIFAFESGVGKAQLKKEGFFKPYIALFSFQENIEKYEKLSLLLSNDDKIQDKYLFS